MAITSEFRRHVTELASAGRLKQLRFEADRLSSKICADDMEGSSLLGVLLTYCGAVEDSVLHLQRAVDLSPGHALNLFNLATAQRMAGYIEEAEANINLVIQIAPEKCEAYVLRSDLRRQTGADNHVAQLERALAKGAGGAYGKTLINFALAKELDDIGEFDRAFAHLKEGNDHHLKMTRYRVEPDLQLLDNLNELYRQQLPMSHRRGSSSREPIFIVGLPRSGTTLVDRIVSGHPSVTSAGELRAFQNALADWQECSDIVQAHREAGSVNEKRDFSQLAEIYLAEASPINPSTDRFTDKMPVNYLHVPLIAQAFPRSPIILVRRDSIDACFAMYRSFLTTPYGFTNSLDHLCSYYSLWRDLMKLWKGLFPDQIVEVNYEDLALHTEPNARRLLTSCGLGWADACLANDTSGRTFATASAVQVRKPIFATSIGKWRNYEEFLEPLAARLEHQFSN